jgi:hypothetical protein
MKKIILPLILLVVTLSSCEKMDVMYNHCYTFDKTKFGVASSSFMVDHVLTKEEEKKWCAEMNNRVIENLKKRQPNLTINDIDTSYVYLVRSND